MLELVRRTWSVLTSPFRRKKEAPTSTLPKLSAKEFLDAGYLLEVNRRVLHPLGLAMYVDCKDDGTVEYGGVYDNRDDLEGWYIGVGRGNIDYDDDIAAKIKHIAILENERRTAREGALGYWIQPMFGENAVPLPIDVDSVSYTHLTLPTKA